MKILLLKPMFIAFRLTDEEKIIDEFQGIKCKEIIKENYIHHSFSIGKKMFVFRYFMITDRWEFYVMNIATLHKTKVDCEILKQFIKEK